MGIAMNENPRSKQRLATTDTHPPTAFGVADRMNDEKIYETDFPELDEVRKMREMATDSGHNLRHSITRSNARSFSVRRISDRYKNPAKKIQEYAKMQEETEKTCDRIVIGQNVRRFIP
ncbi:MAG TPA: hypothetical protein VK151_12855 [Fluviicola sp.]|nr:hypothetical protein [Fluviicola sp.]